MDVLTIVMVVLAMVVGYWGGHHQGVKSITRTKLQWVTNYHRFMSELTYRYIMLAISKRSYMAQQILNALRDDMEQHYQHDGYKGDYMVSADTTQNFIRRNNDDFDYEPDDIDNQPII